MSATALADVLIRASLEAALVALAVGLLLRLVPGLPAAGRGVLWWLASLRALIAFAGVPGIALPLLPEAVPAGSGVVFTPSMAAATGAVRDALAPGAATAHAPANPVAWLPLAALLLWAAGAAAMLFFQTRHARRVLDEWRRSAPLESEDARRWLADWLGERAERVTLRTSDRISAPLILGWGRPRILLPAPFPGPDAARARMALAHEVAHLVRRDLWWGWVPALAECVFWFHPIVRWGVREYAQAREESCDALAIELTGAEPGGYGEMLVDFGVDRARFGHAAASCGSRHVRQLTRRLQMLTRPKSETRTRRVVVIALLAVAGLLAVVPMRVVAARRAASEPAPATTALSPRAAADPAPAVAADDDEGDALRPAGRRSSDDESDTPRSTTRRSADDEDGDAGFGYSWTDHANGFSYGLMRDGDDNTFSGSFGDGDWDRLKRMRRANPGRILWFRLAGRDYVVHDRATWNRVQELMKPQMELGRRQGELGSRQAELGEQQARLGSEQAELGARQAELSAKLASLTMDVSFGDATRAERAELRRRMDEIEEQIHALSEDQRDLGGQQRGLGDRQRALGEQQRALGERQREEANKARAAVKKVAEECVRDGRAERWEG